MDLEFINKKVLPPNQFKDCVDIIVFLDKCFIASKTVWVSGKDIAKHLNIKPVTLRKHIQILREHNDQFRPAYFLIAGRKGYKYTKNKKEIKEFAKSIQTRATSALEQVNQAYKITKKGW